MFLQWALERRLAIYAFIDSRVCVPNLLIGIYRIAEDVCTFSNTDKWPSVMRFFLEHPLMNQTIHEHKYSLFFLRIGKMFLAA